MEKRTLIALALSFLVLGFYPVVLEKLYPDYYKHKKNVEKKRPTEGTSVPQAAALSPTPLSEGAILPAEDKILSTDSLALAFNSREAGIRQIELLKFSDPDKKSPITLLSLEDMSGSPTSAHLAGEKAGGVLYTMEERLGGLVASAALTDGLRLTKDYTFRNGYAADLRLHFENTASAPVDIQYQLFAGNSIASRNSIDAQYTEANFFTDVNGKKQIRHVKESKAGKSVTSSGALEWVATKNRHFSIILKPKSPEVFSGLVEGLGDHRFRVSLVSGKVSVPAGGVLDHDFLLYIGPNDIDELMPLGLDPIVNFGKLDGIGKLLVGALELLHKGLRNYGLAIIALTILINLLLFPLTRQSYMSMKRMQLIQPQMTKLRDQNKKNPEKLNREMMELYKKHKVNPFGGCLPMFAQMPVFIALYVALSKTVKLVDAKFLWVNDLSSPDNVRLPFTLPFLGDSIHILPLIMVLAMVLQQKFTQIKIEGQDPAMESQQKMMAFMMPIIFGFIFYTMPSGLVIYWLTNTILMAFYQFHLKKMTLT